MTSFSEEHAPPPRPLGPEIPAGVRRAITTWFAEHGVGSQEIRLLWFQRAGYGDARDVGADVRDRWGEDAQALLARDLEDDVDILKYPDPRNQLEAATGAVYRHVPAPLYLDYLELAIEAYVRERAISAIDYLDDIIDDPRAAVVQYLNGLFATRRIDYRFDENGRAQWHGDEGAYAEIIRPALDALDDERLAGCREEFDAALGHLRKGTRKDYEDAIEEAWKSVESAMQVLLDGHNISRPERETTEPLWIALNEGGVVERPTRDAIVATSRIRNTWGHGQGAEVRVIPDGIPELAVRSAAAAIAYLAKLLP